MRGGRPCACSSHLFWPRDWRLASAFFLWVRRFESPEGGVSLEGRLGSRFLVGRPKRHMAGDIFVSGLGLFLYCRRALWKDDCRDPPGPVFPAMSLFMVFTPVSALLLAWGKYAEETRCMTPQLVRSSSVVCDENSGLPSDVSVVGMPKVEKVSIRVAARPLAPLEAGDTTGQPEYLSTSTRYADPSWWKKSAQMCWKGYSDWIGVIDGMGG